MDGQICELRRKCQLGRAEPEVAQTETGLKPVLKSTHTRKHRHTDTFACGWACRQAPHSHGHTGGPPASAMPMPGFQTSGYPVGIGSGDRGCHQGSFREGGGYKVRQHIRIPSILP